MSKIMIITSKSNPIFISFCREPGLQLYQGYYF